MPERELQTSEQVNLHERGGLTPAHWQEVIKRIRDSRDAIAQKVMTYAQKVISGEFPDSGFHHRSFLGRRHWRVLSQIKTKDKLETHGKIAFLEIPFLIRTEFVDNQLASEITKYADLEKNLHYTLDDYFNSEPFGKYMFDRLNRIWHSLYSYEEVVPATPGGNLPATSSDWSRYDEHTETFTGSLKLINENPILNLFLLTKDEVQDPLHTPPQELEQILRGISVEILNGRLRAYLNRQAEQYQLVGGWEKEF